MVEGEIKKKKKDLPSFGSLLRWPLWPKLGQSTAGNQELLGLSPCAMGLGHPLLLSHNMSRGAGLEVMQPALELHMGCHLSRWGISVLSMDKSLV